NLWYNQTVLRGPAVRWRSIKEALVVQGGRMSDPSVEHETPMLPGLRLGLISGLAVAVGSLAGFLLQRSWPAPSIRVLVFCSFLSLVLSAVEIARGCLPRRTARIYKIAHFLYFVGILPLMFALQDLIAAPDMTGVESFALGLMLVLILAACWHLLMRVSFTRE